MCTIGGKPDAGALHVSDWVQAGTAGADPELPQPGPPESLTLSPRLAAWPIQLLAKLSSNIWNYA